MGRIRPEEVILRAALLSIVGMCLAASAQSQDTVIKVNVRLVRTLVTVKDASGQLIGSLDKKDFAIFDNGVKQDIALFERQTEQPLSVAMLVDTSGSVGIELKYEIESVSKFIKALLVEGDNEDAVSLFTFNWQVTQVTNYTRSYARLDQRLRQIRAEGGTSLYDALSVVSPTLESRQGRHVIVLVTDGGDTTSRRDFHQALEAAQLADAVMYPILVVPIKNEAGRNIGGEHALINLAAGTGGRVFTPTIGELDRAFTDILRDLRTQYLIGFYPKDVAPTKDRFHSLKVNVQGRNLRVLARSGYYGEFEGSPKGAGR